MNEAKGNVYYGIHLYPGLAEYAEPNTRPTRIFLNENVIRKMGPSFEGRPVFVDHVDEVGCDINEVRKDADGWVVESFYNQADGKHWVKFIVVTDRGERAIKNGYRLSNCYVPKSFGPGGTWNGMDYDREVTSGEYEHLAIVRSPRYEESIIMTPEQFKQYNESKINELKRLANDKQTGEGKMKLTWFKRAKVENSADIENTSVVLPKSGREIEIIKMINELDEIEVAKRAAPSPSVAVEESDRMVTIDGVEMTISELIRRYKELIRDDSADDDAEDEDNFGDEDEYEYGDDVRENGYDAPMTTGTSVTKKKLKPKYYRPEGSKKENEDDDSDKKDKEKDDKDDKKKNSLAKEKADRLRNAGPKNEPEEVKISLMPDQVARGRQLYGSNFKK